MNKVICLLLLFGVWGCAADVDYGYTLELEIRNVTSHDVDIHIHEYVYWPFSDNEVAIAAGQSQQLSCTRMGPMSLSITHAEVVFDDIYSLIHISSDEAAINNMCSQDSFTEYVVTQYKRRLIYTIGDEDYERAVNSMAQ